MFSFRKSNGLTAMLLLALIAALPGCGATSTVDDDANDPSGNSGSAIGIPAGATNVSVQEIPGARTPISSHRDSSRVVIRSGAAWEAFWQGVVANVLPRPAAPVIDFDRYMVLAATMGQRPSGGYAIQIDSVFQSQGTLYAVVRSSSPGPACLNAAVITAPVVAVRIDRANGPVRFVERRATNDCR